MRRLPTAVVRTNNTAPAKATPRPVRFGRRGFGGMRETQETTIDGVSFRVAQLGFKKARKVFMRVSKVLGPALATLGAESQAGEEISNEAILGAISGTLATVSDEDLDWLADTFGETTWFSRDREKWPLLKEANREMLFGGGNLLLFFRWIKFCLEVNFSDFLSVLGPRKDGGPDPEKG